MKKRTKISLVVVALICGISLWTVFKEDYGVGVNSVPWLPPEAHNITYIRTFLTTAAEFDIQQKAFEQWCASRKMPLRMLGAGEHYMVLRSMAMLEKRAIIPVTTEPTETEEAWRKDVVKQFTEGDLFYERRRSDGGGYIIGYDVKGKRGYYYYSPR